VTNNNNTKKQKYKYLQMASRGHGIDGLSLVSVNWVIE